MLEQLPLKDYIGYKKIIQVYKDLNLLMKSPTKDSYSFIFAFISCDNAFVYYFYEEDAPIAIKYNIKLIS